MVLAVQISRKVSPDSNFLASLALPLNPRFSIASTCDRVEAIARGSCVFVSWRLQLNKTKDHQCESMKCVAALLQALGLWGFPFVLEVSNV